MTAEELDSRFQIILDKVGSPYLTDTERSSLYNMAQLSVLDDYVYNRKNKLKKNKDAEPPYGYENTNLNVEAVSVLIVELSGVLTSDANGKIQKADIDTQINVASGKNTGLYHVANMARQSTDTNYYVSRFVRLNDLYPHLANSFKAPTESNPSYTEYDSYYVSYPLAAVSVNTTVLRYPEEILVDDTTPANNVDPEFSDKVTNEIILRALQLAGVSIREAEFYGMVNAEYTKD